MSDSPVIYEEKQKLNLGLLWLPILAPMLMMWYAFYQQIIRGKPVGTRPAPDAIVVVLFVIFGLLFPYLMLKTVLVLQVRPDGFYFRYYPFQLRYRKVSWLEIKEVKVLNFSPVRDFGGYGIKYARGAKIYVAKGNKGIKITPLSGRQLIFSSDNPEMLLSYMSGHWHRQA
ncbi:MAG: hypothetical protein HPY46_05770 [Candidatus Aminicenantes bacterium]|nr:hypothetical protein [Candidatus Aminicenantes bacterium]